MSTGFRISIAIPLHNEESVLPELLRRTLATLDALEGGPHELLFVDDGSTDRSAALVEEGGARDARIVLVELSRNFGHQAALSAALDHVTGDACVVMDGDLQDAPEAIPLLVAKHLEGFDVVYAQRTGRKESWILRFCYFVFYRLMASLSDIRMPLDSGDFGLMSRRVIDELRRMPEHHRYLRGMRTWVGYKQIGIVVERLGRHSGKSKYSFLRLLKLAADGLFAFSIVPIRAAALLGFAAVAISSLFGLYAVIARVVLHKSPQGFTSLLLLITFLSGILLFFLGVIGEYVGRIYEESKGRPLYIVNQIIRSKDHPLNLSTRVWATREAEGAALRRSAKLRS
jgi:glycosyltransferase involved in cell wall biosynthesis